MAYKLLIDEGTDYGKQFIGRAERCTFEFSTVPEQIPGGTWLAQQIVNRSLTELQNNNSNLLWIKIWRDVAPTWSTDYRVEITATASPLWWTAIILAVLAIVVLLITWRIVETVTNIDWGKVPPIVPAGLGALGIGLIALVALIALSPKGK